MGMINKAVSVRRGRRSPGVPTARECAAASSHQRQMHERLTHRRVVVGVDGSPDSAAAFQRAASQARQRNAMLDVVCVLAADADDDAATKARVMLGAFTRRECPYGVGAPVRLRVERGDPKLVLLLVSAGAELLVVGRESSPSAGPCQQETTAHTAPATHSPGWLPAPFAPTA